MIPYELDPSLHSGEPQSAFLSDGFSPALVRVPDDTPAFRESAEPTLPSNSQG